MNEPSARVVVRACVGPVAITVAPLTGDPPAVLTLPTNGALAGAAIGAFGGPPGAAAGAIIGGIVGAFSAGVAEKNSADRAARDRELDA